MKNPVVWDDSPHPVAVRHICHAGGGMDGLIRQMILMSVTHPELTATHTSGITQEGATPTGLNALRSILGLPQPGSHAAPAGGTPGVTAPASGTPGVTSPSTGGGGSGPAGIAAAPTPTSSTSLSAPGLSSSTSLFAPGGVLGGVTDQLDVRGTE